MRPDVPVPLSPSHFYAQPNYLVFFCETITWNLPCEQWFLQAGRYASMGKKPLRATFFFSIEHARPGNDYEYPTTRRQGELQQNNSLISKTTTLHVHHAFIFTFLCHFCTTTTWRCLILPFMDNVNKQRRNLFFFSLLNLDMVPWNSTPFGFAYIWQSKQIVINNPKKYWISTAGSR